MRLRCSPGAFGSYWSEQQTAVRVAMGDADFDAAYASGAGLGLEEAVAIALTIEHPDLAADSARFFEVDAS